MTIKKKHNDDDDDDDDDGNEAYNSDYGSDENE